MYLLSLIKIHKHDARNNKKRYKCYVCKKTFTNTSNTTIRYLHRLNCDKFQVFIKCMMNNLFFKRIANILTNFQVNSQNVN